MAMLKLVDKFSGKPDFRRSEIGNNRCSAFASAIREGSFMAMLNLVKEFCGKSHFTTQELAVIPKP